MQPLKLKVGFARFPYAGSGSNQAEYPAVADWLVETILKIVKDERCESNVWHQRIADTPITMSRNQAILRAMEGNVDVLVMVDADMHPDLYVSCGAEHFWDSSFDYLYDHWRKGPCIVFAPYCGPPPHPIAGGTSIPYVFQWSSNQNSTEKRLLKLDLLTREEASRRDGMEEVAAAPTGLMMVDMRIFRENRIPTPWFDYEWEDPPYNSRKSTTEDVYFTRNCWLAGVPVICNWGAWAGHVKQEIVGKPMTPTKDDVQKFFHDALSSKFNRGDSIIELNAGKSTEEVLADLGLSAGRAYVTKNGKHTVCKKKPKKRK